jgi:hypothetical protein
VPTGHERRNGSGQLSAERPPGHTAPGSGDASDDIAAGLERLIEAASRSDGAGGELGDDSSFAAHLRRQLDHSRAIETTAETAAIERPSRGTETTERPSNETETADDIETTADTEATDESATTETRQIDAVRSAGRVGRVQLARSTRARRQRPLTSEESASRNADAPTVDVDAGLEPSRADTSDPDSAMSAADGEPDPSEDATVGAPRAPEIVRGTDVALVESDGSGTDTLRRQFDLAAGAIGRLVEQLSDVVPVAGSRIEDLSRVTLAVTTPDGNRIEVSADLNRAERD